MIINVPYDGLFVYKLVQEIISKRARPILCRIPLRPTDCPICGGNDPFCTVHTVPMYADVTVSGLVRTKTADMYTMKPYGIIINGDAQLIVPYVTTYPVIGNLPEHIAQAVTTSGTPWIVQSTAYFKVDSFLYQSQSVIVQGVPPNRIHITLKQVDSETIRPY